MYMDGKDPEPCRSQFTQPYNEHVTLSSLPPEILSLILFLAQPKRRITRGLPFEVVVSHVSSVWRGVALTTPALWTNIEIYSRLSLERTREYLRRSGTTSSLDFLIDIHRAEYRTLNGGVLHRIVQSMRQYLSDAIAKAVLPQLHRARNISILCFNCESVIALQKSFRVASTPLLRSLIVKYGQVMVLNDPFPVAEFGIFEPDGCPQLTNLETETPNILPPLHTLQKLTTLHLHPTVPGFDYQDFVTTLTSLPSVLHLTLEGAIPFGNWPLHVAAADFTLNHLKSLRLLDDSMMATRLLLSMSAPKLESLWLECSFDNFHYLFDAPQMQGGTKFRNLEYFTVQNDDLSHSVQLAKIFPSVTHIHYRYPNSASFGVVETVLSGPWLAVETLVFSMFKESSAPKLNTALLNLLPRRRTSGHPMKALLVDGDHLAYLRKTNPRLFKQVRVQTLATSNYREYWWNKFEEQESNAS